MELRLRLMRRVIAAMAALFGAAGPASANVNNWNFANTTFNQSDSDAGPTVAPGIVHLTNASNGEVRSVFDDTLENIQAFTASFDFQAVGKPSNTSEFGATFIVQDNGLHTVATDNEGVEGYFGYNDWQGVFNRGVAVSLEYGSISANSSSTAIYKNGSVGSGSTPTGNVNLFSGDLIDVSISYDGSLLHENLLDTVTDISFDTYFPINIAAYTGSSTDYVGFTANTANTSGAMDFSNFYFTTVPEPATIGIVAVSAVALLSNRRRFV